MWRYNKEMRGQATVAPEMHGLIFQYMWEAIKREFNIPNIKYILYIM